MRIALCIVTAYMVKELRRMGGRRLRHLLVTFVMPLLIATQLPTSALAQTCSPVGYWTSTNTYGAKPGDEWYGLLVGEFMVINPDLTGTLKLTFCDQPHTITVTGSA